MEQKHNTDLQSTAASLAPDRTAPVAQADGRQEVAEPGRSDAPLTNRASDNCNEERKQSKEEQNTIPYFQSLRWGVDSLYLSYPGELFPEVLDRLKALKLLAQSTEPEQVIQAQYPAAGHLFEVKDKAAKPFLFTIEDGHFRIQLARPSKTVPMAYVKVSSGYLAHISPIEAEKALLEVLSLFGEIRGLANVSRIDLFTDFVTSENIEWDRKAWVTRAAYCEAFAINGRFSGWMIGKGGILSARLYDKILEIQKNSHREYLFELWRKTGWNPGHPVWRLEFQFKREILVQQGLPKLDQVMNHLDGLWSYATTEWLRLTIPNVDDKTRSRWPVHPLWGYLASVDWDGNGGPLLRNFDPQRIPGNDKLFSLAFSHLVTYMAREGITDLYEGQEAFITALYQYHENKAYLLGLPFDQYIAEKVALKARQFNTLLNNPAFEEEHQAREQTKAAMDYRKASDGE